MVIIGRPSFDQQHGAARRNRLPCAATVSCAVAFGIVGGGIEQEIDRLIAFQIDDPQRLPGRDMVQPGRARRHDRHARWCREARRYGVVAHAGEFLASGGNNLRR
jgi:hypothetical protein